MRAEPWDVGTGVRGYRWRSDRPRAALLLQHGLGEYAERYVDRYSRLVPRLVELGFDTYAFDAQGHGRSPGRRGLVDVGGLVGDHLAARRAIGSDAPLFLFGHSLGGLVSAASVAREPAGVAGVVLSAPALLIETNPLLRRLAPLLGRLLPRLLVAPPLDASGVSRIDEEVRAYQADPMIHHGPVLARTGATMLAAAESGWPRYRDWRAPVLVVHGDADPMVDVEGSRRFVDRIAATDKRLHIVTEGRHEPLNDLDRERTLAVILDWLRERLPA